MEGITVVPCRYPVTGGRDFVMVEMLAGRWSKQSQSGISRYMTVGFRTVPALPGTMPNACVKVGGKHD